MAPDENVALSGNAEPVVAPGGTCDECYGPFGQHLKDCSRRNASTSRVVAQEGGRRVFVTGDNSDSPLDESTIQRDTIAAAEAMALIARAAGAAAQEAIETEAERVRLATIASWRNPLDMVMSEFPDQATGASWWPWRTYLKVVHGLALDPDELAFAQKCTGRTTMPTKPVRRVFCGPGRRGGKSFTAAIQAVYTAVRPRTWPLAPGEWSTIPVVAADRRQARVIFGYIKGLFETSPRLAPMLLRKPTKDTIVLTNQTRIEIHTANYRTTRGYTLAGFYGDETAFWENSETSSNPDTEILNAIRPGLMTSRGPLSITSTPYSRRGVLWQGFKDFWGKLTDEGLYWKASSLDMNPNLDPEEIARAYEEDSESAAAEYGGEFRTDLAAFISEDLINAVVIPGRGDLPYNEKYKYSCFVDPSGGSEGGDSFTLAIGHTERDNLHVIDCIREVTPPYSTEGTVASFTDVMAMYHVRETTGDHYAGEWPTQMFRDHGAAQYHKSDYAKSDLYLQALPLFTSGRIELPEHKKLLGQLRGLERRTARSGKDSIDHPPRGKDDVANAVCGLLALLARKRQNWGHIPAWHVTRRWTSEPQGQVIDSKGTRYLGDGRIRTASGEDYRDPRCS